jgi:hypothetical protein
MCRNIRPLFNFDPPANAQEITKASEQFVRKLSGFTKPSQANITVFNEAITEIAKNVQKLLDSLVTDAPKKNREVEAAKQKKRFQKSLQRRDFS